MAIDAILKLPKSDQMFKLTHLHLEWPAGKYNFNFGVNKRVQGDKRDMKLKAVKETGSLGQLTTEVISY